MRGWWVTLIALLGLSGAALAAPEVGDVLPALALDDCGEMALEGDEIRYRPWNHAGEPLLLNFMAARPGLDKENTGVLKQLLQARPALKPLTVTLLPLARYCRQCAPPLPHTATSYQVVPLRPLQPTRIFTTSALPLPFSGSRARCPVNVRFDTSCAMMLSFV